MIFKDLRLYLSEEFPRGIGSEFLFRSCYFSNFLTRRVRALRLLRDYKGFIIQGCQVITPPRISPEANLIVSVGFSSAAFAELRPGEEHEFFVAMTVDGLDRCAQQHQIPIAELTTTLEEFRRCGYRNEWTYQRKLLRQVGLQASLLCSLDPERFRLVLKLEKKHRAVFEQQILETKPDELIFAHRFKEVVVDGDSVVVKDKFGKALFSMPIPQCHA